MSKVRVLVGTEKGAFVFSSDRARRSWQVEGPLFKGWKVTASARSASGRYFLATASQVYGAALHVGEDFIAGHPAAGLERGTLRRKLRRWRAPPSSCPRCSLPCLAAAASWRCKAIP